MSLRFDRKRHFTNYSTNHSCVLRAGSLTIAIMYDLLQQRALTVPLALVCFTRKGHLSRPATAFNRTAMCCLEGPDLFAPWCSHTYKASWVNFAVVNWAFSLLCAQCIQFISLSPSYTHASVSYSCNIKTGFSIELTNLVTELAILSRVKCWK